MSLNEENFESPRQCSIESESVGSESNRSQVPVDMRTLCILKELNGVYEQRLIDIDKKANADSNLKYATCKEWNDTLKRIINDLLNTVDDLEYEACQRIALLERKLKTECAMDHTTNEVRNMKNDLFNLLEFLRRGVEENKWDMTGLDFYTISKQDILHLFETNGGNNNNNNNAKCSTAINPISDIKKLNSELVVKSHEIKKLQSEKCLLRTELENKDIKINDLKKRIRELENSSFKRSPCSKAPTHESISETIRNKDVEVYEDCINDFRISMQEKEMQLAAKLEENECLQSELQLMKIQNTQKEQAVTNMKVLALEVADKHDQLQQIKFQIFSLEEDLKRAHKKIQFKDNVIKELRKECKNISKCACISRSANTSPRKFLDKSCNSFNTTTTTTTTDDIDNFEGMSGGNLLSLFNLESHALNDDVFEEQRTISRINSPLDTILEIETNRIKAGQELEAKYIKLLKNELDELFKVYLTSNRSTECQKRIIEIHQTKVEELIKNMLIDLRKIYAKLTYVKKQLTFIIDSSNENNQIESDNESGYLSQEDMEPELSIINSIKTKLQKFKTENFDFKNRIYELQEEIQKYNSTISSQTAVIKTNDEIFKNVAGILSNMCGREISDTSSESINTLNPLYEAALIVQNLFAEKEQIIQKLEETVDDLKKQLQCTRAKKTVLEHEIEAKDQAISDLNQLLKDFKDTVRMLEAAKTELKMELGKSVQHDIDSRYMQILDAKNKLEIECNHQQTTIQNLRQALESVKRCGGNNNSGINNSSSSVSDGRPTTNSGSNRGHLWNWWHSNVHDV